MPILMEEVSLYPATLLDSSDAEDGVPWRQAAQRQWWGVYTKARQEKALARYLLEHKVPFYLPLVRRRAVYHRRRVTVTAPLFGGYLFLYGTEEERVVTLSTNRISRFLPVDDAARLEQDLRQIHRLITSDAPLTVESRLVPGDPVRVRSGPLKGLEGAVLVRRGQTRLLVRINFLQQGASVEIDDFLLEPIR